MQAYAVGLHGRIVAHLFQRGDHVWLEWQDGYWDDLDRPVLGLAFEDQPRERVSSALKLPAWFSNLLPEGVLREWVARDAHVSPDREMMLLRRLGRDLPGAVTVTPADGPIDPIWRPDRFAADVPSAPRAGSGLRFSLAGVALKFSMVQRADRLTLPGNDEDGDWIVKMPDAVYPAVPQNEFAMMTMVHHVGIDVPPIRLVHRDELPPLPDAAWPAGQQWAYAISRFDREPGRRVHIEDFAQVRGFMPRDKYRGTFKTVAALAYRRRDIDSYLEFIRRLFFSYAIGNGDMHLKNTSFIYPDGRRPRLSPAYDLVSTAPYRLPDLEDLGLRFGRTRRFEDVSTASFEILARRVGAPVEQTRDVLRQVAHALPEGWSRVEDDLNVLPGHQRWLAERLPQVARRFG